MGRILSGLAVYGLLSLASLLFIATDGVQGGNLEQQIQQLNDLKERRPIIRLNPEKFKKYIGSQSMPRNYSFIVMMTALSPQRGCQICKQAYEEFLVTANSYRVSQFAQSKRLYFGLVDYDEGSDIFRSLNLNSAPSFFYFSEEGNFRSPDELNIQRLGFGADVIARWVAEKTGMQIKIIRPPNLFMPIVLGILFMLLAAIMYFTRHSLTLVLNRNIWAFSAVALVLLMTSGQMWNHIRGAPLMQRGRGHNTYIHGSSSGQFVIETYIVIVINAGIAIGIVLMTDGLRAGERSGLKRKNFVARLGFGLLIVCFSLLLAIFRQKSYGYPYRLLF